MLGDFHKGKIPSDENSFYKCEYIGCEYVYVTVDVDNQPDLDEVSAMLFIYDVGVEQIEKLKSLFDEIQKSNKNEIPYALALNYESDKQDDAVSDETVDELFRDFQCKVKSRITQKKISKTSSFILIKELLNEFHAINQKKGD